MSDYFESEFESEFESDDYDSAAFNYASARDISTISSTSSSMKMEQHYANAGVGAGAVVNSGNIETDAVANMHTFSVLTQRTLSAFHKAGVDADLYALLHRLKIMLRANSSKPQQARVLVTATAIKERSGFVKRYFMDGYSDEVALDDIARPSLPPTPVVAEEEHRKLEALVRTMRGEDALEGSISIIKSSPNDSIGPWREVKRPSERAVFRTYT